LVEDAWHRDLLALLAFVIFGPLANLFLWAFAEKWYFEQAAPEFGFTFWARVFAPRGNALASLGTTSDRALTVAQASPSRFPPATLARSSSNGEA
jgi:hypothetical protein